MLERFSLLCFLGLALTFSSCETEFSLNGDYKLTPVAFGILDHNDSVHVIKITKAFLGDGDNLLYAQNPDSNYFESVDARIIEYDGSEKTGREWQLNDSIFDTKDTDGIFYGPDQKAYVFHEKNLDNTLQYELVADLNEGALSIKSKTGLLEGFGLPNPFHPTSSFTMQLAKNVVVDNNSYLNWRFIVTPAKRSSRYEIGYTFSWIEHYVDGSSSTFSETRLIQTADIQSPDSPNPFNVAVKGLSFYEWVGQIVPDDPEVDYRESLGISMYINGAHQDLAQYMDVSKPVTGLAQVQPEYTNIENGYGIFSSRLRYKSRAIKLSTTSIKELVTGQYTASKAFCSSNPAHAGSTYYCP